MDNKVASSNLIDVAHATDTVVVPIGVASVDHVMWFEPLAFLVHLPNIKPFTEIFDYTIVLVQPMVKQAVQAM